MDEVTKSVKSYVVLVDLQNYFVTIWGEGRKD